MEYLKCAHLNVRSLLAHFSCVKNLILENKFHIFGMSETWLDDSISDDDMHINNYNFIRLDRGSRGGGVGFYIRNDLRYSVLQMNEKIELIWVKVAIGDTSFALSVSYRAPSNDFKQFFNEFETSLSYVFPVTDSVFCLAKYVTDIIEGFGMKQLVKQPTRITENSATLADYIVVSNEEIVSDVGTIHAAEVSDHELVYCIVDVIVKQKQNFVTTRNFKSLNYCQFQSDLQSIPWRNIYDLNDADSKASFIADNINKLVDLHVPLETYRITKRYAP
nr:unnamed protein product [Callosobruchus analis]